MEIFKSKLSQIIVDAPKEVSGIGNHRPGLLIELSADETQIVLYHFYYDRNGGIVCTQNVNIAVGDLSNVIANCKECQRLYKELEEKVKSRKHSMK